jgi:mono/diheme cytochrome c family protein
MRVFFACLWLVPVTLLSMLTAGCNLRPHDPVLDERPPAHTIPSTGRADRGQEVAERWCSQCHLVPGRPTRSEHAKAPSFVELAADPEKNPRYLAQFLDSIHPPMPTYRLFPEEKQDLLAYLASLRPRR